ncbi:MAG TPA: MarR family transcriptional regulator [Acidimicrobiales bacterium]|nr:MarR family transcriptional regulator [Acidimicrobiales bacterium]
MSKDGVARFVERFALVLDEAGMPRMPARAFVAILISDPGRLTAGELASTLQVSPAAISGAVRYLLDAGFVHREREPGARVDSYAVAEDVWSDIYFQRVLAAPSWEQVVRDGVPLFPKRSPGRARLEETADFFAFVREEMPKLMEKWARTRSRGR